MGTRGERMEGRREEVEKGRSVEGRQNRWEAGDEGEKGRRGGREKG